MDNYIIFNEDGDEIKILILNEVINLPPLSERLLNNQLVFGLKSQPNRNFGISTGFLYLYFLKYLLERQSPKILIEILLEILPDIRNIFDYWQIEYETKEYNLKILLDKFKSVIFIENTFLILTERQRVLLQNEIDFFIRNCEIIDIDANQKGLIAHSFGHAARFLREIFDTKSKYLSNMEKLLREKIKFISK